MSPLAMLAFRGCLRWSRISAVTARSFTTAGVKCGGGPPGGPTDSLGGIYTNFPTEHKPPSQEEISSWVKKEMEGNWKSYGFDFNDQKIDAQRNALVFFLLVSVGMVTFVALHSYRGDVKGENWAIREAYLLLREREAAGVEPLSRDLIDPEKVLAHLPSDEELKKMNVQISI